MDGLFLPYSDASYEWEFVGQATTIISSNPQYVTWVRPKQGRFVDILLYGPGGNGGTGTVGGNSTAAGGGGGGSGGIARLLLPFSYCPRVLYLFLPAMGNPTSSAANSAETFARIVNYPVNVLTNITGNTILSAKNGGNGGNASGATAGAAGAAGTASALGDCMLAQMGLFWSSAGTAGIIGGTTVAGGNTTMSLPIGGGTGGGGLPATAAGTVGGAITIPVQGLGYVSTLSSTSAATATTPPNSTDGISFKDKERGVLIFTAGSGSGSTHGTATGAGLVQVRGGNGQPGCGGGGTGGALTGATQLTSAQTGRGGASYCQIRVY